LATVVGIEADRLTQMLPPAEVGMKLEPIRLCAACYTESPCHKIEWQLKVKQGCVGVRVASRREARRRHRHKLHLLSECPNCGGRFKIPALWIDGHCQRCFMRFTEMVNYQKFIEV
jgi:protein-arginine kinase activator protein McsA